MNSATDIPFTLVLNSDKLPIEQPSAKIYYEIDDKEFKAFQSLKRRIENLPKSCTFPLEFKKEFLNIERHKIELNRMIQILENEYNQSSPVKQYTFMIKEKKTSLKNIRSLSIVAHFKELSPTFTLNKPSKIPATITDYEAIKSLLNGCYYITKIFTPKEFEEKITQKKHDENKKQLHKVQEDCNILLKMSNNSKE